MRQTMDIEQIKERTIQGQLDKIAKKKVTDADERVRVPEYADKVTFNPTDKAKTRN